MNKICFVSFVIAAAIFSSGCGKSGTEKEKTPESPILTIEANGVSFNMIRVEGGTFDMGATPEQGVTDKMEAYRRETPVHPVTLDSYYIGETEVTQELWEAVMGTNASWFQDDKKNPVDRIGFNQCKSFISKLNTITGKKFRLPTEAQWEFAARGGNKSRGYKYSGSDSFSSAAWLKDNSGDKTHPVKTKVANELGIYDMSGNVWEWCADMQGYYPTSMPQTNPTGPKDYGDAPQYHVFRGGDCSTTAWYCRISYREVNSDPVDRAYFIGFRLAL
ncbi:MAG: SUMF1/EgtB/PvdO family nonheme iron enzyme [Bacteroidales bacterium]|nr:SUMF1/EgtB/PvdO family nonheme iron enzyme [Bacteroidales bacterium]